MDASEEEQPLLVTIEVEYDEPEWPGVPHNAVHRFVDWSPDFEKSNAVMEAYWDAPGVIFRVRHGEVPNPVPKQNHMGTSGLQ